MKKQLFLACKLAIAVAIGSFVAACDNSSDTRFSGVVQPMPVSGAIVTVYRLDTDFVDLKGAELAQARLSSSGRFDSIRISDDEAGPFLFEVSYIDDVAADDSIRYTTLQTIYTGAPSGAQSVNVTLGTSLVAAMMSYTISEGNNVVPATAISDNTTVIRETLAPTLLDSIDLFTSSPVGNSDAAALESDEVLKHRLFLEGTDVFIDWLHTKAAEYNVEASHDELLELLAAELGDDQMFNGSVDIRLVQAINNSQWWDHTVVDGGTTLDSLPSVISAEFTDAGEVSAATNVAALSVTSFVSGGSNPMVSATSTDLDGDDIVNSQDPDIDGDGVDNTADAFPANPVETTDTDDDGFGDQFENQLEDIVADNGSLDQGTSSADNTGGSGGTTPTNFVDNPVAPQDSDGDGTPDQIDISPTNPLVAGETCSSGSPDRSSLSGESMLDPTWDACSFWREVRKTSTAFDADKNMATKQSETGCEIGAVSNAAIDRFSVAFNYARATSNLLALSNIGGPASDPTLYLRQMQWSSLTGGGHTPVTNPPAGFTAVCINQLAEDGGSSSNLAGGNEGTDPALAVLSLINDRANSGGDPYTLGHRWHMLDAAEDYFTYGQGLNHLTIKVFGFDSALPDSNDGSTGLDGQPLEYTATPYQNYPFMMIDQDMTAWHFQVVNATSVDLSGASVTIVPSSGGTPLSLMLSTAYRAGEDTPPDADNIYRNDSQKGISFTPANWQYDTTYSVMVDGIVVDGVTESYQYETRILKAPLLGYTGIDGVDKGTSGVLSDINSELMWEDPAALAAKDNWTNATDYCANLSLAGHSDWRLPSADDLDSITFVMDALTADGHQSSLFEDVGTPDPDGTLYMWINSPPVNEFEQSYDIVNGAAQGSKGIIRTYRCVREL